MKFFTNVFLKAKDFQLLSRGPAARDQHPGPGEHLPRATRDGGPERRRAHTETAGTRANPDSPKVCHVFNIDCFIFFYQAEDPKRAEQDQTFREKKPGV